MLRYAILAPLFVGFFVGPRCLMGVLAGAIASGCMMAIMMSNAGGAWDNSKKLCEKLQIKKTDQGKACVVLFVVVVAVVCLFGTISPFWFLESDVSYDLPGGPVQL